MDFDLPPLLERLLAEGRWSTRGAAEDERILEEVSRRWDPHARGVHLEPPSLLADDLRAVPELAALWNVDDVDPECCLVIGDFGLGSDNPIVLDFSVDPPAVRSQRWPPDGRSQPTWITLADSFDDFVALLGVD